MYGKYIIATDEALEGYKFEQSCMARCNTVSEFVAAINDFKDDNSQIIPSARQLFQDLYSYSSSVIVIKNLLKDKYENRTTDISLGCKLWCESSSTLNILLFG